MRGVTTAPIERGATVARRLNMVTMMGECVGDGSDRMSSSMKMDEVVIAGGSKKRSGLFSDAIPDIVSVLPPGFGDRSNDVREAGHLMESHRI